EEQREVLIMVGATGLSYEETAEICGVAIGTIKSRVNRARTKLAELLSIGGVDDLGPDRKSTAAMQRSGSEIVGL
ncbi:MAG: sigma factor-like helix-turn-helix DNA-binding protein, partial [Bosea sp. (in: a-proteobacteria)]